MSTYNKYQHLTPQQKQQLILRRRRLLRKRRRFLFILLLFFTSISLGFYASSLFANSAVGQIVISVVTRASFNENTNILLLGADQDMGGGSRSDTIMVLHVDPGMKRLGLISIPRDTLVQIPGKGWDKANHAFAYGGVELSRQTISNFLNVPIPYYAVVNIKDFEKIVDRLGGITIDVEKPLYYNDYAGRLHINIQPGVQKLNGQRAIGYVRFRHDAEGDINRIGRQQKFLLAAAQEALKLSNIYKVPDLVNEMYKNVNTNLNMDQLVGLAFLAKDAYSLGNIETEQVPGYNTMINGVSYRQADTGELRRIKGYVFGGLARPRGVGEIRGEAPSVLANANVEVLNGIGVGGAGSRAARLLKARKIKVVNVGDARDKFYSKSVIVCWDKNENDSQDAASYLNIAPTQIIKKSNNTKKVDYTVIIGSDWGKKI